MALDNLDKDAIRTLYTTYLRPILQFAASTENIHLKKHKAKLEIIQRYAARIVLKLIRLTNENRLQELQLITLEKKRSKVYLRRVES